MRLLGPGRDRPPFGGERSGRAVDDVDQVVDVVRQLQAGDGALCLGERHRSLGRRTRSARSPARLLRPRARAVRGQSGSRTGTSRIVSKRSAAARPRPASRDGAGVPGPRRPADAITGGLAGLDKAPGTGRGCSPATSTRKPVRLGSIGSPVSPHDQPGDMAGQNVGGRRFRDDKVREPRPAFQLFIPNERAHQRKIARVRHLVPTSRGTS